MPEKPVEWIWYGRDEEDVVHVSTGRWQFHPCQSRYKYALPQATEHDHDFTVRDHLRALSASPLSQGGQA